jgi:predicted methyltransferase
MAWGAVAVNAPVNVNRECRLFCVYSQAKSGGDPGFFAFKVDFGNNGRSFIYYFSALFLRYFPVHQYETKITMRNPSSFSVRSLPVSALALCLTFAVIGIGPAMAQSTPSLEQGLAHVLGNSIRSDANRARDQYRHPLQTLAFFGVRPDSSVLEITPGGGWYLEILAPLLNEKGQYIAGNISSAGLSGASAQRNDQRNAAQKAKFEAAPVHYSHAKSIEFALKTPNFGPDSSVDFVLTFRNAHNWIGANTQEAIFKAAFAVLKPGGVFGVVDHRGAKGKTIKQIIESGYLPEQNLIDQIEKAGFKLEAASEVNANPKDTKTYKEGVWTLPPVLALKDQDRARYLAIGESDRFTLRFVKPK